MKLRSWLGLLGGAALLAWPLAAGSPEEKLRELGLELPPVATPVANYVPAVRTGNLIYLAGHLPRDTEGGPIVGRVPSTMDVAAGRSAAERVALALLASLQAEVGELSKVTRIVRVEGYVASDDNFTDQPQIINGCSDLLVTVFGDKGRHTRTAIGVNTLPLGAVVEIAMIVEVKD